MALGVSSNLSEQVQVMVRLADRFFLVRDYSQAVGRDNWILPYGLAGSDESDEAAAMRVAREGLGLDPRPETVWHLGSWFDRSTGVRCATVYVAVSATDIGVGGKAVATEVFGFSAIRDMIRTGVLVDSHTLCGLAHYMSRA